MLSVIVIVITITIVNNINHFVKSIVNIIRLAICIYLILDSVHENWLLLVIVVVIVIVIVIAIIIRLAI